MSSLNNSVQIARKNMLDKAVMFVKYTQNSTLNDEMCASKASMKSRRSGGKQNIIGSILSDLALAMEHENSAECQNQMTSIAGMLLL